MPPFNRKQVPRRVLYMTWTHSGVAGCHETSLTQMTDTQAILKTKQTICWFTLTK
ncbi:hypothetical protein P691DRAFT_345985 [Macrolepiota fuliginosa MF-IS2]|uniref:Uncharacterized protein n=1 Tax=Macrolepiota fuliginosa MF-IS2 TaxID=1400762 RepID=A0A9P5XIZ5_9AGAR|nr:hypothetical protein P691DRAFT_345985 [Macrolepiota fuliginosa MF-IS2]